MWSNDKSLPFSEQLDLNEVNIIEENLNSNDVGITCILNKIQKLFENTANSVLGYECEYKVDANAKRKPGHRRALRDSQHRHRRIRRDVQIGNAG